MNIDSTSPNDFIHGGDCRYIFARNFNREEVVLEKVVQSNEK